MFDFAPQLRELLTPRTQRSERDSRFVDVVPRLRDALTRGCLIFDWGRNYSRQGRQGRKGFQMCERWKVRMSECRFEVGSSGRAVSPRPPNWANKVGG